MRSGPGEARTILLHIIRKILFRNGNLTLALAGWWRLLWAGSGCGGSGRAPGWCGWAAASLLRRCCGGAVCWRPVISLPAQSVVVGEVGRCVGVRWLAVSCVGVLRTGPVAAGVRVYSSVKSFVEMCIVSCLSASPACVCGRGDSAWDCPRRCLPCRRDSPAPLYRTNGGWLLFGWL